MAIIQLQHYKKLGYSTTSKKTMLPLPEDLDSCEHDIITFRPLGKRKANLTIKKVSAITRFIGLQLKNPIFYGIQADSPLAPLIFWDVAHILPIGGKLTVIEDTKIECFMDKEYYREAFSSDREGNKYIYTKKSLLLAEQEKGLDEWTFGIPVGPEDATLLNKVIERILEIDIPSKEIILCGRPNANFKYFEQVRIVGEDIKAPPVHITAKKNRIAQEASYKNLCILHDRVYLPKNFAQAIQQHGDFYSLTTFQSIFFDDKFNFIPRRYSDYNIANKLAAQAVQGLFNGTDIKNTTQFSRSIFSITDRAGFYYANPLRYSMYSYPTGSLYICKRSIWLRYNQDERLYWTEFEDIEQAFRASMNGVPSQLNPYALTQSLIARPLLSVSGIIHYENYNGAIKSYKPLFERMPIPRKPLLKVSYKTAINKTSQFIFKYIEEHKIPAKIPITSSARTKQIIDIIYRSKIPIQKKAINNFLMDYEKNLLLDQLPYNWIEDCQEEICRQGKEGLLSFLLNDNLLYINQLSQRSKKYIFFHSLEEYLQKPSLLLKLGCIISTLMIKWQNKKAFYFKLNIIELYNAILETTAFKDKR